MLIDRRTRGSIQKNFRPLMFEIAAKRAAYPQVDKAFGNLEAALLADAEKRGINTGEVKTRLDSANTAIAAHAAGADAARAAGGDDEARDRARGGAQGRVGPQQDPHRPAGRRQPVAAAAPASQRSCLKETPPDVGADDMLFAGNDIYDGGGPLKTYEEDFNTGDPPKSPDLTLALAGIVLGERKYRATHVITEEDVLSNDAAAIAAMILAGLAELLFELGKAAAKAFIQGELHDAGPSGIQRTVERSTR